MEGKHRIQTQRAVDDVTKEGGGGNEGRKGNLKGGKGNLRGRKGNLKGGKGNLKGGKKKTDNKRTKRE